MTYLYAFEELKYTIFEEPACLQFLQQQGIEITKDFRRADVIILRDLFPPTQSRISEWIKNNPVNRIPMLVWTHEPRFCRTSQHVIYIEDFPVHIMNMYTGNVYFSNFTIYGRNIDRIVPPVNDVTFSQRPIAGLATYVLEERQSFVLNNIDIDLTIKRQCLLYEGYCSGMLDIYGKKWPGQISISESRGTGWHKIKLGILQNYQFNIAMENTAWDYYCTEKIWDSIKSHCLPVYSGRSNKIYENFPENSFIDYDEFDSNRELLLFIKNMSKQEYLNRLNVCIQTFNAIHSTLDVKKEKQRALMAIVSKIQSILS
jgi:hypothetical protein